VEVEPPEGWGRVLIATDVPASVVELDAVGGVMRHCRRTPCSVVLPYGDHVLHFQGTSDRGRSSQTHAYVGDPSVVINHTLGQSRTNVGQILGSIVAVSGLAAIIIGGAMLTNEIDNTAGNGAKWIAGGLAAAVGGGILVVAAPGVQQAGSSTAWAPQRTPTASLGLGWKF
jgi:hypothetical protein